ncbi:MAG: ClpXP protease specificity-enhancing factor SspB [Pseudomonadota bacterium]
MASQIDYGRLMHSALRQLMAEVLSRVSEEGLPGDHHFYITFDTSHAGVDMADWLRERYPGDMTIVIQNWFDGLAVMPDRFAITLNFGNSPEPLVIPFDAVKTFVDPSVEFGLRFDGNDGNEPEADTAPKPVSVAELPVSEPDETSDEPSAPKEAEVVSLDTFRKT